VIGLSVAEALRKNGCYIVYFDPTPRDPKAASACRPKSLPLNVSGVQQLLQRDGLSATRCGGFWIARSGSELNNASAIHSERFSNSQAYDAETHNTSKEAVEAGKIIRDHASAKLVIPSGADFCVGPGETAQKNRSCGNHILGDGLVAAARNISHGNA